ncbi:MAG TPA: protein kinase [Polyangium sp.]|nr:protein kinase [Polyangium sp.]
MLQLGNCILGEVLHEGIDTIVRRAKYPSGESFVLKISTNTGTNNRSVGRLMHEHRLLDKLQQVSGVVRARGFEHEGTKATLWLEDQGMRSLDRIVALRGALPIDSVVRLGLELSRILERIHAAGVVHKDIKPQNILWDETTGQVTLLDFAIACELGEEATNAAIPEALEGTLAYISPEQTGRTARGLDARTDLYSFGVTMFELLAGRRPFVEADPLALVHAHLAKPVPSLEHMVPGLSPMVARIVERCLEKYPEKRYQTAKGLVADLATCIRQLEECGTIEPFVLGRMDFSPALRLSQTLVAREREAAELRAAFERAANGAVEVLLLGGPSGVGKTALVRSVYQEIANLGRGLLLSGKHDQLGRAVSYGALAQAFGGFMRDVAASPKPVFDTWKTCIEQAIGIRARVIADIVPELEWLTGPLPAVPVVPTEMTYNRLKLSWIEFVRAVADVSPPLVLFLDDMQWADAASFELLKTLLTDVGKKNLLIIAAYRDNEVDAGHPLWSLVDALEKADIRTPRVTVGPLDEEAVRVWLGSTLLVDSTRARPLAKALHEKTHGNPFFLGQLLLEIHRRKQVRRNLETGEWEWDQDAVDQAAMTDNVVELMRQKVVELPEATQTLLGQAACAGHIFSSMDLSIIAGIASSTAVQDVQPALLAGLVIPLDGHYREAGALAQAQVSSATSATYQFLHDRVQQAFYERIDPKTRKHTHLGIARRLQTVFDKEGGSNQKLLEMVRHFNLGAAALETDDDRKRLARLDLQAAKAAKVNGSYGLQASLVDQARELLGERAWQEEPALSVELALERIEADFMLKEFDAVHQRANELLALPLPNLPRLVAQELRVRAYLASGQYAAGERFGIEALAERGIVYPETNEGCIAEALPLLTACDQWLEAHPEGFSTTAPDPSVDHLLYDILDVEMLLCASLGGRPALGALGVARSVQKITQTGQMSFVGPFFIGAMGELRSAFIGDYRRNIRWASEGEQAAKRLGSPFYPECSTYRGTYVAYERPVDEARRQFEEGVRVAMASGSFQGTSWGLLADLSNTHIWRATPLSQVAHKEESLRELMKRAGDAIGQHVFALTADFAAFLRSPTSTCPADPTKELWNVHSRFLAGVGDELTTELARILEAQVFLAFGAHTRALERANEAEQFRAVIYGSPPVTNIPLWRCLAAGKCLSAESTDSERRAVLEQFAAAIQRFQYFAEGCPDNFLHGLRLLEAERARIEGNLGQAMAKYDEAIDLARKQRFLHIEALAAQFCAEFYLELGRTRNVSTYLHEARDAYTRWEAEALVVHLQNKYPDFLKPRPADLHTPRVSTQTTLASTTSTTTGGAALDVHTAIRAAQALSGELDVERVVGRLMELCLANAGAERGALVFAEQDSWVLVARLSVKDARIETGLAIELAQCTDLATTVVRYVARSREPVVANDIIQEKRFPDDPYLAKNMVRSVLALPLTHRGRLGGILYLEHQTVPSAFPPSRVELLSVLASQAAIAMENAHLYRNIEKQLQVVETRNREVQQLNDELRRQIAQRSHRLMESLLPHEGAEVPGGSFAAGDTIGDCYRVLRLVGEGGMGAVYEVERTTDGQHLAAKVLNRSPDRSDLGRFVREAQILAKLSHPNLIGIYDVDVTDGGVLYIVMEFVAGSTLRQFDGPAKGATWVLSVIAQMAEALQALHAQSIVHRDLKPENILVMSDSAAHPSIKLADFGISIVMTDLRPSVVPPADTPAMRATGDRAFSLTQTGALVGTPYYMAPELGYGSKNAQPASDIFAMGVIAFELFTGKRPYAHPPVLGGLIDEKAEETLRQCPGMPAELASLVARCLEMKPTNRPSASEVAKGIPHRKTMG